MKRFGYYDDVYRIVRLKMDGKLSTVKNFGLLMNMYRNMKKRNKGSDLKLILEKCEDWLTRYSQNKSIYVLINYFQHNFHSWYITRKLHSLEQQISSTKTIVD